MVIHNNKGMKPYVKLEKSVSFIMYLLCVTTMEKSFIERTFEVDTGAIICVEGLKTDVLALAVIDSKNVDSLYISKNKIENVIGDCKTAEIKVDQLYKNKAVFVSVMTRFAIDHNVNFKAKYSDKERYVYLCIWSTALRYIQIKYVGLITPIH